MYQLIVQLQTQIVARNALKQADITFGSGPEATIQLKDQAIAPRHAKIYQREGNWWIQPLDTQAKIYLNAVRIPHTRQVNPGDIINIEQYTIYIEYIPDADYEALTTVHVAQVKSAWFKKWRRLKSWFKWTHLSLILLLFLLSAFIYFRFYHPGKFNPKIPAVPQKMNHATEPLPPQIWSEELHRWIHSQNLDTLFLAKEKLLGLLISQPTDTFFQNRFIQVDQKITANFTQLTSRRQSEVTPRTPASQHATPGTDLAPSSNALTGRRRPESRVSDNQPPVVIDFWLFRDKVLLGTKTPVVILAQDSDGDSLFYEWAAFYGQIQGQGKNVLYATPVELPTLSEDLITVTVSDGISIPQKFFRTVTILKQYPLAPEQKRVAREFYNLALRYEKDYGNLTKSHEYLKKVLLVAPDSSFSYNRLAKQRIQRLEEIMHRQRSK
ncbi:FHA domain-containing protein [candidate division KSB1 bacterium]|nr:FHA domain-containing protein [candidate division KSB1 bacterium]